MERNTKSCRRFSRDDYNDILNALSAAMFEGDGLYDRESLRNCFDTLLWNAWIPSNIPWTPDIEIDNVQADVLINIEDVEIQQMISMGIDTIKTGYVTIAKNKGIYHDYYEYKKSRHVAKTDLMSKDYSEVEFENPFMESVFKSEYVRKVNCLNSDEESVSVLMSNNHVQNSNGVRENEKKKHKYTCCHLGEIYTPNDFMIFQKGITQNNRFLIIRLPAISFLRSDGKRYLLIDSWCKKDYKQFFLNSVEVDKYISSCEHKCECCVHCR